MAKKHLSFPGTLDNKTLSCLFSINMICLSLFSAPPPTQTKVGAWEEMPATKMQFRRMFQSYSLTCKGLLTKCLCFAEYTTVAKRVWVGVLFFFWFILTYKNDHKYKVMFFNMLPSSRRSKTSTFLSRLNFVSNFDFYLMEGVSQCLLRCTICCVGVVGVLREYIKLPYI